MAPSGSMHPDASGRSDALRVLRPVVAALATVVIVFCGWSAWEYSQGNDPLAFLGGALQTVEQDAPAASIELDPQDQSAAQASEEPGENPEEPQADDAGADADSTSVDADAPVPTASSGSASAPSGTAPSTSAPSGTASGSSSGSQPSSAPSAPSSGFAAASPSRPVRITVSITVDGSAAGAGSSSATLSLELGSTVYDALAASGVSYNAKSTGYGMYVSSIAGLAEKDHGGMSGWLYSVNGVEPNYACSSYELSDGDSIYWWYANVEY